MATINPALQNLSEDENKLENSIKNNTTKPDRSQINLYKSQYYIQRKHCSNYAIYEKIINTVCDQMGQNATQAFEMYDTIFNRHTAELQETRKAIRLNIHSVFVNMKSRHIVELTDLEISHVLERKKAIQHPCVQENQLIKQAQKFARIHNLQEAFSLRDKAKEISSFEKEKRGSIVDQKYQIMFQRLENKQKNELIELQNQFVLSAKKVQVTHDQLILKLQKKTVANVKNILNRSISQCRKEVKNQAYNHKIAQKLTEAMNQKICDGGRVNIFLSAQN